jgi:hypothetical protein
MREKDGKKAQAEALA